MCSRGGHRGLISTSSEHPPLNAPRADEPDAHQGGDRGGDPIADGHVHDGVDRHCGPQQCADGQHAVTSHFIHPLLPGISCASFPRVRRTGRRERMPTP
jgi:hypothetical protein